MANLNSLFIDYDSNLSIPDSKREKMNRSREHTRERISRWFSIHAPGYPVSFWIQGSHKNHLNIRTLDEECDQDDGIYIDRDPSTSVDGYELQSWIFEAVTGSTSTTPEHKERCIRNFYQADKLGPFHIDYPSYYKTAEMPHPLLTVKNGDLEDSDPEEFNEWLKNQVDDKGQLRRVIRYLKGWADFQYKMHPMPNGLTLTILACNAYVTRENRDDESFYLTLLGIHQNLEQSWQCIMPAVPYDNLLEGTDESFKMNFMQCIESLLKDGKNALEEESAYEASQLWKKHLGPRFPLSKKTTSKGNFTALATLAMKNKPYYDGRRKI